MFESRTRTVRRQMELRVNRLAALSFVVMLSVLLLHDMSLWVILLPLWLISWVIGHIVGQQISTAVEDEEHRTSHCGSIVIDCAQFVHARPAEKLQYKNSQDQVSRLHNDPMVGGSC
jgi:hypothetical protein